MPESGKPVRVKSVRMDSMRRPPRRVYAAMLAAVLLATLSASAIPVSGPQLSRQPATFAVAETGDNSPPGIGRGNLTGGNGGSGSPGALRQLWDNLMETAVGRRVREITGWVASLFRFLWTIPKALLQGDSQSMIEALGELLSRASDAAGVEEAPAADQLQPQLQPLGGQGAPRQELLQEEAVTH